MISHDMSGRLSPLLQQARRRAGLTQQELAERSAVSVRAIRDLELGRVLHPRKETLRLLVEALQLGGRERAALEVAAGCRPAGSALEGVRGTDLAPPPMPIGPLIGRAAELGTITDLFVDGQERLLTIVGVAGSGKTRLAQETAHVLHDRQRMPVLWVPAEAGPGSLQPFAHWVRGLLDDRGSYDDLAGLLAGRTALMVLDGLDTAESMDAPLTGLLHACPGLRILVTAREPRPGPGGRILPLVPLPARSPAGGPGPAVELMLSYLSHLRPDLAPGADTTDVLALICELFDGLPRALEAASSWLLLQSPAQLLETARVAPLSLVEEAAELDGQQGPHLGEALARTIARLRPPQAELLRAAGLFGGPWTLEELARHHGWTLSETGRAVHALLLRGLIRQTAPTEGPAPARFSALNLVACAAGARAADRGLASAAC